MAVEERAPAGTALTLEQFLALRRPTEVVVSPDGRSIAFSVSASYAEKGSSPRTGIWTTDLEGNSVQATAGAGVDASPRWSADGGMAFASDRGHPGRMAMYLLGPGPGEARAHGDIPGSVEDIAWSPDGKKLLVLAADLGADRAGFQAATRIQESGAEEDDPKVTRPLQAWRRLYLVDAESGETHLVSPEGVNVFEYDWDGERV